MTPVERHVGEALAAFDFGADVVGAVRYGAGHVNDTFCVHTQPEEAMCRRFILQRINSEAFKRPDELMSNITGVTDYLRRAIEKSGGDSARGAMTVVPTREGRSYFTDSEGGAWRAYNFVEHTKCFQSAETPELFAAAGRAFGNFQRMLGGYPADTLYETIPRFHDTEDRLRLFKEALAADPLGRAGDCERESAFILAREKDCSVALDALREGKLPLRVTHNDTKLNNVLFDARTRRAICVIDLDTVMPGLAAYDFGDAIRSGASTAAEDEPNLELVRLSMPMFCAYAEGYLGEVGETLSERELLSLPVGARMMALETAVRFLTDYLQGDTYYRIAYPGHNLVRARTQLRLYQDMTSRHGEMEARVMEIRGRKG